MNLGAQVIPSVCVVCGEMRRINPKKRYRICGQCHDANARLLQQSVPHNVPEQLLVKWIESPLCDVCGKRFYTGRGSGRSGFAVDHDHDCCHGGKSCGRCVRGVLCAACNMSLGHVESMIGKAGGVDQLVSYLRS